MYNQSTIPLRVDIAINPSPAHALAIQQGSEFNNMAQQLLRMGRFEEAERLHRKAIEVKERGLGTNHITTALSYNAIGEALTRLNRLDEAEGFLLKARKIREASRRPLDEIDAAGTRENLAVVYEMRGDLPRARQMRRIGSPDNMLCAYEKVRVLLYVSRYYCSHTCGNSARSSRSSLATYCNAVAAR